jgi:hypothetical protein
MPRKEFESFTRLDASDVNTFLMDQSVQTFAGTAARGSAIATPVEGMVTYLNDIDSLSVYNGTAFTTDRTIQVFAGTAARGSAIGTAVEGMYTHINDTDSLEYYDGSAWVAAGGGSNAGLTLINTTSFSAVASESVNDVFSADYDNYKIIVRYTTFTGTPGNAQIRLRVGGSDNTNNEYTRSKLFWASSNTSGVDSGSSGTSSFLIGEDGANSFSCIELYAPFLTEKTKHNTQAAKDNNGLIFSGSTTVTTSYTGFTLLSSSATNFTGSVSVYGYNK